MNRTWTEKDIQFLRDNYPEKGLLFCARHLAKKQSSIKAKVGYLKIRRTNFYVSPAEDKIIRENIELTNRDIAKLLGVDEWRVIRYIHRKKLRSRNWEFYTEQESAIIEKLFTSKSYAEIGNIIGRSHDSVKIKCTHLGLKRTKKQVLNIQKTYCSNTQFNKGNIPSSTLYDGAISERKDSNGITYKHIRISKAVWQPLHIYNWENKNGPVPDGMILRCKDTDQLNCDPLNWEPVNRNEHLELNLGRKTLEDRYIVSKLTHRNPELKETISQMPELIELKRNQIKLRRAINEHND